MKLKNNNLYIHPIIILIFMGKLNMELPEKLHQSLKAQAATEGFYLYDFILKVLEDRKR